jgi:hypothetical protein
VANLYAGRGATQGPRGYRENIVMIFTATDDASVKTDAAGSLSPRASGHNGRPDLTEITSFYKTHTCLRDFNTCATMQLRPSRFSDTARRRLVFSYRCFVKFYWTHLHGSRNPTTNLRKETSQPTEGLKINC